MTKSKRTKSIRPRQNIIDTGDASAETGEIAQNNSLTQRVQGLQIERSSAFPVSPARKSTPRPVAAIAVPDSEQAKILTVLTLAVEILSKQVPEFKISENKFERVDLSENKSALSTISRIINEANRLPVELRKDAMNDAQLLSLLKKRFFENIYAIGESPNSILDEEFLVGLSDSDLKKEFVKIAKENSHKYDAYTQIISDCSQMHKMGETHLKVAGGAKSSTLMAAELYWDMMFTGQIFFFANFHDLPCVKNNETVLYNSHYSKNLESLRFCVNAVRKLYFDRTKDNIPWIRRATPVLDDLSKIMLDLDSILNSINSPYSADDHSNLELEFFEEYKKFFSTMAYDALKLLDFKTENYLFFEREISQTALTRGRVSGGGDLVSVLDPSGIHILAKVNRGGATAQAYGNDLKFEKIDDDFRLISKSDDNETDDESIEDAKGNQQTDLDLPAAKENRKLLKLMGAGKSLLEKDLSKTLYWQKSHWKNTSPEIVWAHYNFVDESLQSTLMRLEKIAQRIKDKLQPGEEAPDKVAATDMVATLEKQTVQAKAILDLVRSPDTRWSMMKGFHRPQASYLAELIQAEQVAKISLPVPLASTPPNTLFEIRIEHKPDADGTHHPPVWLHLHSHEPMQIDALRNADHSDFTAIHLKSDADKNRGAEWIASQKERGLRQAFVHRSPVNSDVLEQVMNKAFSSA